MARPARSRAVADWSLACRLRTRLSLTCDSFACFNDYGSQLQEEMAIDLLAEQVLLDRLSETGQVAMASCKAEQVMRPLNPDSGSVSVTLDPIDAASPELRHHMAPQPRRRSRATRRAAAPHANLPRHNVNRLAGESR